MYCNGVTGSTPRCGSWAATIYREDQKFMLKQKVLVVSENKTDVESLWLQKIGQKLYSSLKQRNNGVSPLYSPARVSKL